MRIFHQLSDVKAISHAIATIGTFDGVHLGHQAIFKKMRELAQTMNGETVVVTFSPHPRQVLQKENEALRFITTPEQKFQKFEEFGIDNVLIINFTKEFSLLPSEDFIKDYILQPIRPDYLVVGYDHHFGKNRTGDFDMLSRLSEKYGFKVEQVSALDYDHVSVSSTKIRQALSIGDVRYANQLLGYAYSVTAEVVRGNEIGRTIGFPTANLELPKAYQLIANPGVYACLVDYEDSAYKAMANFGLRPTIGDRGEGNFIMEVNIFDFDGDLYGKHITVHFIDRIRSEKKFNGLAELKAQLAQDRETAKRILADH